MTKFNRIISLLLILVFAFLSFAACESDETADDANKTPLEINDYRR
ncbi:MAG: hypothetical protein HFE63_05790 [Clostridiales bacterium]|nr:hypothetical protein [Clostridiales bacterium]